MDKDKSSYFDPRIFISKPFLKCPKCYKPDSFGTNWISGNRFTRRCRECLYLKEFKLPRLDKKVIYLDQFVISLMMKAINDKLGKVKATHSFWLTLFKKIDRLLKLQLIICPDSTFLQKESALYQFDAQKRMYEYLSNGASFCDAGTVRRFQLTEYFRQFVKGIDKPKIKIERSQVIKGGYNDWQERIRVAINFHFTDEEIKRALDVKKKIDSVLLNLIDAWKNEKGKAFKNRLVEEVKSFGQAIVKQYFDNISKLYLISMEEFFELIMSNSNTIVCALENLLPAARNSKEEKERTAQVIDFLLSERMADIPSIRLMAQLWSALADQYANAGKKKIPGSGIANDISMVSTILPYCDAIFIDREVHGLIKQPNVAKDIEKRYHTEVYSAANKDDFIVYLDNIEKDASRTILDKVREVYGPDWLDPFTEMYNVGNSQHV